MPIPPPIRPGFSIVRDGDAVPPALAGAWVAIGNFDGLHRGHRAALGLALDRARAGGLAALALTFEPHPRRFFMPNAPTFRLTPEPAKLRLFAATGLDGVVVKTFNAALAGRTAEEFILGELIGRLRIGGVVVGDNFRCSCRRPISRCAPGLPQKEPRCWSAGRDGPLRQAARGRRRAGRSSCCTTARPTPTATSISATRSTRSSRTS
jgi:hypothetical protein